MGDYTWLVITVVVIVFGSLWLFLAMRRRNAAIAQQKARYVQETEKLNYSFEGVEGADRFGPSVLAAGVHVSFREETWLVGGSAALREGDRVWYEHLLQSEQGGGNGGGHWISVEDDGGRIRLGWWDIRDDVPSEPGVRVTVDGREYLRQHEGEADFAVSGLAGAVSRGRYFYRDFADADGDGGGGGQHRVRVERWGEDAKPEASVGREIGYDELRVLPPRQA